MKRYKLKVKTKNKTFIIRGKPVRTPFVVDKLTEKELNFYLSKIRLEGIREQDYEIIETSESSKPLVMTKNFEKDKNVKSKEKEEISDNEKTTIEKLLEEDGEED